MAQPAAESQPHAPEVQPPALHRDHGFHQIRVARVIEETPDTSSLVLDIPDELRDQFGYAAGQFCTFRVHIDGTPQLRSYSMSSAPAVDDEVTVTVKRVPGGLVSNWMNDHLTAGAEIEATLPAGVFCLTDDAGAVLAFAGGSGITPVISIIKTALASTDRTVRLLYANRDRPSTIFAGVLDELVERHPGRLEILHHHDVDGGFVTGEDVGRFLGEVPADAHAYVCGPAPFMDLVEEALVAAGVEAPRLHIERFTHSEEEAEEAAATDVPGSAEGGTSLVTIELDGRTEAGEHRPGTTILQTARQFGMTPPFSCESGSCATCMGRVLEGTVTMRVNDALTDDEVAEGWILTCQSVPTSEQVHVIYGYD